jgi:hypothetical protein
MRRPPDRPPAGINALLDESLSLAHHGARAGKPAFDVTLQRDFDPDAGMIEVFPQEITRVFLNLLSNGFYALAKRMKESGGTGFDPMLRATTRNLGDAVEIRIRDNGAGIPPEVRDKILQSVLHDQACRRGYRPRPLDEPRHHRQTAWRQHRCGDGAGAVHGIYNYLTAGELKVACRTNPSGWPPL